MITNLDPEIIAGFVKEVESYLPKLVEKLELYRAHPEQIDELEEAHRLVHCIRGAGATIGLYMLSQLAQYPEDTLEQLLTGQLRWNEEIARLLESAALQIAELLNGVESGRDPEIATLMGMIRDFRRVQGLPESGDDQAIEELFATPEEAEAPVERMFEDVTEQRSLDSDSEVMQVLDEVSADDDLWAAFQEESSEHFESLAMELAKLEAGGPSEDVMRPIRRSFHQLKGASGVVGLRNTSKVCAGVQKILDALNEGEAVYHPQMLTLFNTSFEVVLEAVGGRGVGVALRHRAEALFRQFETGIAPPPAVTETASSAGTEQVLIDRVEAGDDLWVAFQQEAEEHLNTISELLRNVQKDTLEQEAIQVMRRSVHTFKGACGVVGMRLTSSVAHRMEDLLDALYEGRLAYRAEMTPVLFATFDLFADSMQGRGLKPSAQPVINEILAGYATLLQAVPAEAPAPAVEIHEERRNIIEDRRPAMMEAQSTAEEVRKSIQFVRAPIERVDELVRLVSELVIHRSRFEQYLSAYVREVEDLHLSIERLTRISGKLQSDYEAVWLQEANRHASYATIGAGARPAASGPSSSMSDDFDTLEFDRYTEFHLLSRDLAETTGDVNNTGSRLQDLISDFDSYLNRLGQLTGDVEEKLTRLRMLPLRNITARLHRTVRVTAERCQKPVNFIIDGESTELDKTALEEMAGPLDHILRNAIDHGLEIPELRVASGKTAEGTITLRAYSEGAQVVLQIRDDGQGLNPDRVLEKARRMGVFTEEEVNNLSETELYNLIFMPGFSTASEVSDISGRGVGLDVVKSAVSKMRGTLSVSSERGKGTTFTIRLPMTQSLTRVVLVKAGMDTYAIPLSSIHQVLRVEPEQLELVGRRPVLKLGGKTIPTTHLGEVVGQQSQETNLTKLKAIVLSVGENRLALMVDQVLEAREVVVKPLSGLLGRVHGVTGATLMGDGSVVLILNPNDMLQHTMTQHYRLRAAKPAPKQFTDAYEVLVVDDSPSVRRVVASLVKNAGWTPHPAKDGLEALELIHSGAAKPEVVLLDIEMPRMDGYEFTATLRAMPGYRNTPIVMLTSRAGEKHRKRAFEVGATAYMVKPYQDEELLTTVRRVVAQARGMVKR